LEYFLAVDGGGTKTDLALFDDRGRLVARERRGPSNYQNVGADGAEALLRDGIQALLETHSLQLSDVSGACLGLAGLDTREDELAYEAIIRNVFGDQASMIRFENDCFIALHSGTLGGAGIALIAGTGSMAIGCNERGERARSGGWGHRFGDEGSGKFIGHEAIVRSLKARDGRGEETALVRLIEEMEQCDLFDLVTRLNIESPGPDKIASYAPLVTQAAEAGDAVALQILEDAARELVTAARAITRRLEFERRPIRFILRGGAFHSNILRDRVEAGLRSIDPETECMLPLLPPVAGAFVLALQSKGIEITPEIEANLKAGLT